MKKNTLIQGAAILTAIGILTRIMGFFYRIFLSRAFGEENVGLYQLVFPIYALCLSFSTFGIQTALSRIIAYKTKQNDNSGARHSLVTALATSILLSFISLVLLQQNVSWIANFFIRDSRCIDLLIAVSYAIPFAAIHGCICGYYFGLNQTAIPAISQLLEQVFRIGSVFIICQYTFSHSKHMNISYAVFGLVIGEIASSVCSIISLRLRQNMPLFKNHTMVSIKEYLKNLKELTSLSVPLSANRMILTLLQSYEAVSIPRQLQIYHYTVSDSLSIYGVLTGMALPCIMFPSAITNSIAVLLTPKVAGIQSVSDRSQLKSIIRKTVFLCCFLGLAACFSFLLFGNLIGNLLFHSELAGKFIRILAWICPFLYLNTTLASILNGLGKTNITFFISFIGILIRILSILYLIPLFDLRGYLWGLLASQIFTCILYYCFLKRNV